MNVRAQKILDTLNLPSTSYWPIYASDIVENFDLDKRVVIKEFQLSPDNSFEAAGKEFSRILVENKMSTIIFFIVVPNFTNDNLMSLLHSTIKNREKYIYANYTPNEGECDRIIGLMQ